MNREMLDLLKSRTAEEGLPVFINHDAIIAALGTTENITLIPMSLDEVKELMIAERGVSIDCTDQETMDILFGYMRSLAKRCGVAFERCNFNRPLSGAKLHSGVYVTIIAQELDTKATVDSVVNFWYVTTNTALIR